MIKKLNILVADDEPAAREKIVSLLNDKENVGNILQACNGIDAVRIIDEEKPDLVFLDIQMPKLKGLEVVEAVGVKNMPVVIFVTAFDQYAINAFDLEAVDYLLKPFDPPRFEKAFQRATKLLEPKNRSNNDLQKIITELRQGNRFKDKFLVSKNSKYFFVKPDDIYFISAQEKYVELNTEREKYLLRATMNSIEEGLNPAKFKRTHRSYIVNIEKIKEIEPVSHGDYTILLTNGNKVKLARRFREKIFHS